MSLPDGTALGERLRSGDLSAAPEVLNLVENRSPAARPQIAALLRSVSPAALGDEAGATSSASPALSVPESPRCCPSWSAPGARAG